MSRNDLEGKVKTLLRHQGHDRTIDGLIENLQSNLPLAKEQAAADPLVLAMMLEGLDRLDGIIENWIQQMKEPEIARAKEAILRIAEAIVSTLPERVEILLALGDQNNLIPLRGLGSSFVVECSYMRDKTFLGIHALGHEVGHVFFDLYGRDETRRKNLVETLSSAFEEINGNIDTNVRTETTVFLVYHWLNEFVADAVSLLRLGPEIAIRHFEETQTLGVPLLLGSDSHPPDALRIELMRDRCLRTAGRNPSMSGFIRGIRQLRLPSKYEIADSAFIERAGTDRKYNREVLRRLPPSTVSSELAYHKKTISVLKDIVDQVLSWGNVESGLEEIKNAYSVMMEGHAPSCDPATLYGAYLSAARIRPDIDFLELSSSRLD